ncbi:MAG: hypothetical protein ACI4L9_05750 [Candidatus Coproplasma sp.]
MKNTTFKIVLIIGLVCTLACMLFGLVAVMIGKDSFIVAVITGGAATLPVCAELAAVDKRIAAEREDENIID